MAKLGEKEIQEAAEKYFQLALRRAKELWARLPQGRVQLDDLIDEVSERLFRCLQSYDSSQGKSPASWIEDHVQWALLDAIRREDLLPQKKRELVKRVQRAREHLEKQLLGTPTYAEIAAYLECSEKEIQDIVQMEDIKEVSEEEHPALLHQQAMGGRTEQPERTAALQECFAAFTVEEKVAVRMYGNGATLKDVADVLHMPLSSTGRLVSEARQKLEECIQ